MAAYLNKWVYKGDHPPVSQAFFLGILTEAFHMYAILFTNRGSMASAYSLVKFAAVPMALFTAGGLSLCTIAVRMISGNRSKLWIHTRWNETPISMQVQRWLLAATVVLFLFDSFGLYRFQHRMAIETASTEIAYIGEKTRSLYEDSGDIGEVFNRVQYQDSMRDVTLLVELENGRYVTTDDVMNQGEPLYCSEEDLQMIRKNLDRPPYEITPEKGVRVLVLFVSIGDQYALMTLRDLTSVYDNLESAIYENTLEDFLLLTVFYAIMAFLVERLVVRNLKRVKVSLDKIAGGRLDEEVSVRTSPEFSGLSDDINKTVTALKEYIAAAEKRMEDDLKLAAEIQSSSLPKDFHLPTEKVELFAMMTPARQVGGDFYDFFYSGPERLCLVIADVSGKGIPASLFMMRAKTAIKDHARTEQDPAELLKKVNSTLCEENAADMFVTVWLGILDLKTGLMRCCNAAHEYPAILRAEGSYELLKDPHGEVLGTFEDVFTTDYDIQLNPGDRVFVYTDGVPEAVNEKLKQYGTGRMQEQLNRLKDADQKTILEGVLQDIRQFAGTADQFDDITMLGLAYKGNN